MNTLRKGKRKKTNNEKRIPNTFDEEDRDIIEGSYSAFPGPTTRLISVLVASIRSALN